MTHVVAAVMIVGVVIEGVIGDVIGITGVLLHVVVDEAAVERVLALVHPNEDREVFPDHHHDSINVQLQNHPTGDPTHPVQKVLREVHNAVLVGQDLDLRLEIGKGGVIETII